MLDGIKAISAQLSWRLASLLVLSLAIDLLKKATPVMIMWGPTTIAETLDHLVRGESGVIMGIMMILGGIVQ